MARPTTKEELLKASQEQYDKMLKMIDAIKPNATFNEEIANCGKEAHWGRDKNVRDVLVHLHEWHNLLLEWANANRNGKNKPFLLTPYTWKTYGDMNVEFWKKHQDTSYDKAVEMLNDSHKKVMKLIESFSNEELFTKKYFNWTGTSSLGSYCVSTTSSHYDWAIKKIKAHVKLDGAK